MTSVGIKRRTIMIFYSGYLPGKKFGGPVVSISNFVNVCGDDFDIYIVTGNHDLDEERPYPGIKTGWNQVGKAKVMYLADADITYYNLKKIVDETNPDLIYQTGLFVAKFALPALMLAKLNGRIILISPRGELLENAIRQKPYKKIPYLIFIRLFLFTRNIFFHATTEEEKRRLIKFLKLREDRIFLSENFPSLPNEISKKAYKKIGKLNLIYIARIHPIKNLEFALSCLNKINGEITFNIYGPIEVPEYWGKCEQIIRELPSNIQVNYCGIAERDEIHQLYSSHDAMILPTLTENYGHSIVEAMLSGCPVIISDNTPWTDINIDSAGWAIPLSNRNEYVQTIQNMVDMDSASYLLLQSNNKKYVRKKFKVEELRRQYIAAINSIVE